MMRDRLLDSEERNSLALGAMAALDGLISQLPPGSQIDTVDFAYLFRAVKRTVDDAIKLPCDTGGVRCNDD